MPKSCYSSCSHHEGVKAREFREDRLRFFSSETTREGNFLVQVAYQTRIPRDAKRDMANRIDSILVPFERRG
ncbi:hypothetical protein QBC41DRAFT_330999 [Cercophora samala]|uniref:Uncharacterized protein n=1 Tax=Cercophora samala TaxID=330535 RepID=A0AA39YYF3_9PEZI|nr:hypothetical protein QBC41DRAFT_330999 [Cercophora samala]